MAADSTDFLEEQLKFPRVAQANLEKGKIVNQLLSSKNISTSDFDLFLRAFKKQEKLEVWAKNKTQKTYLLIKTYDFCTTSGVLGPKRKSGDGQIPEGFYEVNMFNPQSLYHLSFMINYPNQSDLFFADKQNPGNEIFIHGDCVSVGCIPIGDENIKELYLLAIKAKNAGSTIQVHIFPSIMEGESYSSLKLAFGSNKGLLGFWSHLKPIYDGFEKNKILPTIKVDGKGYYKF